MIVCLSACDMVDLGGDSVTPPTETPASRPPLISLREAQAVAFPSSQPQRDADGVEWTFRSHRLIETSFAQILVSEGVADEDTSSHSTSGRIDVTYLSGRADGAFVRERYPEAVRVGSWGALSEWAIVSNFGTLPTIYAAGGFTGQGITESCTLLVELAESGPRVVAVVPDSYSELGADEITGTIQNISEGQFEVHYAGRLSGRPIQTVRQYVRIADRYLRQGNPVLDHCGEDE